LPLNYPFKRSSWFIPLPGGVITSSLNHAWTVIELCCQLFRLWALLWEVYRIQKLTRQPRTLYLKSFQGASTCASCPKNTYASSGGCTLCPAGKFSKPGSSSCSKCPDNSVSDGGNASDITFTNLTKTNHKKKKKKTVGDDCYPCGLGTTSKSGDKTCSFNCSDLGSYSHNTKVLPSANII